VSFADPTGATLFLEALPDGPNEPESVADQPLVGFDAFVVDAHIYGWVRLSDARLTDLLNRYLELNLVNVQLEQLVDGRPGWRESMTLRRRQLIAVRAGGPRGDPSLRRHARLHALAVRSGPFLVRGYLHAEPGRAPLEEVAARPSFVPLSMASLEYWAAGRRRREWGGTILFNRELVETIRVVGDEDLEVGALTWAMLDPGSIDVGHDTRAVGIVPLGLE
jgi:hypothetical protein